MVMVLLIINIFYFIVSPFSMQKDSPVLEMELDVDEMVKSHKA